jgi:hypothetical protein
VDELRPSGAEALLPDGGSRGSTICREKRDRRRTRGEPRCSASLALGLSTEETLLKRALVDPALERVLFRPGRA